MKVSVPNPPGGNQYDRVVSLGRGCQPAHQIRRKIGTGPAFPFDWIITTDQGLVTLVASDLEGFFARERLVVGPNEGIIDQPTDTQFFHEFPKGANVDALYEPHARRFALLVRRWRALLGSTERVLFVRQHAWDADPRASAVRLRDAISLRAPRLRFTLQYLTADPADDVPWNEEGILNRHLTQPEPYDWKGDDAAWDCILAQAGSVPL